LQCKNALEKRQKKIRWQCFIYISCSKILLSFLSNFAKQAIVASSFETDEFFHSAVYSIINIRRRKKKEAQRVKYMQSKHDLFQNYLFMSRRLQNYISIANIQ
jgi:hypothetical protein